MLPIGGAFAESDTSRAKSSQAKSSQAKSGANQPQVRQMPSTGSTPIMRSSIASRCFRHLVPARPLVRTIAAAGALVAFLPGSAHADDWRYCLAPLHAEHKVYMSAAFPTVKSMERLQDEFGNALARAGLRHGAVQCPRGDEQSIQIMRLQATRFNRESGNAVVEFDRWNP
jgi:hypothetical protein